MNEGGIRGQGQRCVRVPSAGRCSRNLIAWNCIKPYAMRVRTLILHDRISSFIFVVGRMDQNKLGTTCLKKEKNRIKSRGTDERELRVNGAVGWCIIHGVVMLAMCVRPTPKPPRIPSLHLEIDKTITEKKGKAKWKRPLNYSAENCATIVPTSITFLCEVNDGQIV